MKFFLIISDFIIPAVLLGIVVYGMKKKRPVYDDFVDGAKEGMKTVAGILPTLIGLMVGVGVLRASGFLDMLAQVTAGLSSKIAFPAELIPVVFVRMFSSSAATGLSLDIFVHRSCDINHDELHRNHFLYDECLLHSCRHQKNTLDSAGCAVMHIRRHRRKRVDCRNAVK
mgnify:CR=1 FL=1